MRCRNDREPKPRAFVAGSAAALIAVSLVGCASPPSVTPLLRVAEAAVREEAQRVAADGLRDREQVDGARRHLAAAYDADLAAQDALAHDWVRDATAVYVDAREALLRHELALVAERRARAANLSAAADATRRAAAILERQDALITRATRGAELWELLRAPHTEEGP